MLERIFKLREAGTSVKGEAIAGATTFMTMAYVIFVNPAMISQTGIDFGSAMMATCVSACLATILMGLYANYPIAVAPGMGENAFFTYTVCLTMGIPWQTALACVFIEGVLFIALTLTRVRQALIESLPPSVTSAIACGIGLLIAFVGLIDSGIVVAHPATLVSLGDVASRPAMLSVLGLVLTGVFAAKKIPGGMLWAILITAAAGIPMGVVTYGGVVAHPPSMAPTLFKMDLKGALDLGLVSVIFIFLFMGVFDTVGTLAGIGQLGGFMRRGKLPRAGRAFMSDAVGTCIGAACGTPTVTAFVESASGISSGGRTGLTSVVTGALFFAAIFFSPLIRMIGGGFMTSSGHLLHPVTAPALIVVGSMMAGAIAKIEWGDITEALPAFLIVILMPLTFSIANGIAIGLVSYAALKLLTGRGKEVPPFIYGLALVFVLRFLYLHSRF